MERRMQVGRVVSDGWAAGPVAQAVLLLGDLMDIAKLGLED
jgi:hypothetical protein